MNKRLIQAFLLAVFLMAHPWPVQCLEALSVRQMKESTARTGVSVAINETSYETYSEGVTFSDPDDSSKYIGLMNFHRLATMNNGVSDIDEDGDISPLTLDVGTYHSLAMILIDSPDLEIVTDSTIGSIDFCGASLGSMTLDSTILRSFYVYLGPHEVSGVTFEMGFGFSMDSLAFQYNSTDALTLSGLHVAETFGGSLEDPSTWTAFDRFKIGNVANDHPGTLDIGYDTVSEWTFTDTGGTTHTYTNPRYNAGYLALDLSMEGSVRLENIRFGGATPTDLGSVVLDNINVEKLYIEIPGRGLGRP